MNQFLKPLNILVLLVGIGSQKASAQCGVAITLVDSINTCNQSTVTLNATAVSSSNPIIRTVWSPATGLSNPNILNPVVTVTPIPKLYTLSVDTRVSANLITNPDFSGGNTGFSSSYSYFTSGPANQSRYYINTNPVNINPLWPSMGDHTTGTGNMFLADASTSANTSFWCQTVSVTPNKKYLLSAWTTQLYPPQAVFSFKINGVQVGNVHTTSSTSGTWTQFTGEWFSGAATTASICITDTNLTGYGNDFAIDDIAMYEICTTKDSVYLSPFNVTTTIFGDTNLCSGKNLALTAYSIPTFGVTYSWTGPNGFTSSTANANVSNIPLSGAGNYIVTATIAPGCFAKDTAHVVVAPSPANHIATSNAPVCQGNTLSFTANSSSAGVTYGWVGPNSFTSGTQNPSIPNVSLAASGNYIVTYTLNTCSVKDTLQVLVKPKPAAPIAGNNTPVCVGQMVNLTASTIPGVTYSWTGPLSYTSTQQNPSFIASSTANGGIYSVVAMLNGCASVADTTNVILNASPVVNIYPSPNDTICDGSKVTFVALPFPPGANLTYQWLVNNAPVSGATNVSFPTTGIVDGDMVACVMTNPTACATSYTDTSNYIHMTVLPWLAPSVTITSNPTTPLSPNEMINFTATAINAGNSPKYQWQRNNTDIVGAISDTWGTWQLYNNDSISVIVKSSYLCPQPATDTSNYIKVVVLTSVDEMGNKSKITLYPNPSNGRIVIKGDMNMPSKANIEIIDMAGQVVHHSALTTQNGKLYKELNLEYLANGGYTAVIKSESKSYTIKFNISR